MINTLLPTTEKKMLRREYHIRVLIVLLFMVSVAGIIGIVSLFPALVKGYDEFGDFYEKSSTVSEDKSVDDATDIINEVSKYKSVTEALSANSAEELSPLAEDLVGLRQNVTITSMTFERDATTTISMVIQGKAPTRDALLGFKERLMGLDNTKVDLPVSELAKVSDLDFSMKIIKTLK